VSVLPGGSALDFGSVSARTREFTAPEHVLIETRHDAGSRGKNIFADENCDVWEVSAGQNATQAQPRSRHQRLRQCRKFSAIELRNGATRLGPGSIVYRNVKRR